MRDRMPAAAQLWDRVVATAERIDDDQWDLRTPCADWRVHDLLGHLGGLQVALDDAAPHPPLPAGWTPPPDAHPRDALAAEFVSARRDWSRAQILAELDAARASHLRRLEAADPEAETFGPVGQTTEAGLFDVRCFDLWVHLQDLKLALGEQVDVEDASEAATRAHRYVFDLVPWLFAKRAGAEAGATLRITLGAPLDVDTVIAMGERRAAWDADADAGECVVRGAPAAFTLLCSGRLSAQEWRAQGLLDWAGARGAEFVERARLF
jgi:uncharacterized protein (TIGR03083 family)